MSVRLAIFVLVTAHAFILDAADLSREADYKSVEEMLATVKEWRSASSKGEFQKLLSIPEPGELAPGQVREDRIAARVQSCEAIWSGEDAALLFVTAQPPTEATHSEVGLLIYAERKAAVWKIVDVRRFAALGKYARITAELTAEDYKGNVPFPPIVTLKEFWGGRGYWYDLSASYTLNEHKIVRRDLE